MDWLLGTGAKAEDSPAAECSMEQVLSFLSALSQADLQSVITAAAQRAHPRLDERLLSVSVTPTAGALETFAAKIQELEQQVRTLTDRLSLKDRELGRALQAHQAASGRIYALQAGVGATETERRATSLQALSQLQHKLIGEQQMNGELQTELDSLLAHIQQTLGKEGQEKARLEKTIEQLSAQLADASAQLVPLSQAGEAAQLGLMKEEVRRTGLESELEVMTAKLRLTEADAAAALCRSSIQEQGMWLALTLPPSHCAVLSLRLPHTPPLAVAGSHTLPVPHTVCRSQHLWQIVVSSRS